MIRSLSFNYERFGKDSEIERIALRLIEKNLKKANHMFKLSIVIKLQGMVEYFQRIEDTGKEEFMLKMIAGVLLGKTTAHGSTTGLTVDLLKESTLRAYSDQETALHQNVSTYLQKYFK